MLRCQCPSVCPSVPLSVSLSVTEVHWRIIANLGFKFRSEFTAHCGRGACGREGRDHRREEWRDYLLGPLVMSYTRRPQIDSFSVQCCDFKIIAFRLITSCVVGLHNAHSMSIFHTSVGPTGSEYTPNYI